MSNTVKITEIPIFFVHFGYRENLKVPVSQAAKMGNRVIFLGDPTCKVLEAIPGVEHYNAHDYLGSADIGEFVQFYKHLYLLKIHVSKNLFFQSNKQLVYH